MANIKSAKKRILVSAEENKRNTMIRSKVKNAIKKFNKAIEDKKIAEQGALKAKYDLERVTLEAKAQMEKQKSRLN